MGAATTPRRGARGSTQLAEIDAVVDAELDEHELARDG